MPDRRLVVLLSALLLGVLAIGVGTALNRTGDDGGTPNAALTTQPPFVTESPTDEPTGEPTPEPTAEPTAVPTTPPSVDGDTDGDGDVDGDDAPAGDGAAPDMPNTGAPTALVYVAAAATAAATGVRRLAR